MIRAIKSFFIMIWMIFIAIAMVSCISKTLEDGQGENTMPSKTIEEVLKENTDTLMSIPGIVGVAQGLCDDKPCIKVYVIKMTPELDNKIPKILEGYTVSVQETGEIKALPENQK